LRRHEDVAAWLAKHLPSLLCWQPEEATPVCDAQAAYRFAEIAGHRQIVAQLASCLARRARQNSDEAWTLGFIGCGTDLLGNAEDRPVLFAPEWIVEDSPARSAALTAENLLNGSLPWPADAPPPNERMRSEARNWRNLWLDQDSVTLDLLPQAAEKVRNLEQLQHRFGEMLEQAKLDAVKELAYGAGHEINNPLANISSRAQALLRDEADPERRRKLAAIHAQALRAHEMIADLMLFARPPQVRLENFDVAELLGQLAGELREIAAAQHTELSVESPPEPIPISADRSQVAVAIRALCVNALEAVVSGGRVEVMLGWGEPPGDGRPPTSAQIVVYDDGPGLSPEAMQHLFDPFYSGREAGRGLGLGLSKCWQIARAHGGRIEFESRRERGAAFRLTLPCVPSAAK
jgi:signal transduction histidine kinase